MKKYIALIVIGLLLGWSLARAQSVEKVSPKRWMMEFLPTEADGYPSTRIDVVDTGDVCLYIARTRGNLYPAIAVTSILKRDLPLNAGCQ